MSIKIYARPGRNALYLRGTVRGQRVFESTGTSDPAVAEEIRIKREAELLHRSVHGVGVTATFAEAAIGYMEAGGERRYLGPLIQYFGKTKLVAINQDAIDRAARVLKPDAGPATINRQIYTPMSAVLKRAAKSDLCEYRPIARPKQPVGRVRWLKSHEAEQLIAACATHMAPLVIFLLWTGARLSEALYLDWRDIDLHRRQVWFVNTKNDEARGVPLHGRVCEAIAKLEHRTGAVFLTHEGKPYARRAGGGGQIDTGFGAACARAGIKDFTPHDCRHTWATWHYAANRDLGKLMELGGWKSVVMVMRYAHVNTEHLRASIDQLPSGAKLVPEGRDQ